MYKHINAIAKERVKDIPLTVNFDIYPVYPPPNYPTDDKIDDNLSIPEVRYFVIIPEQLFPFAHERVHVGPGITHPYDATYFMVHVYIKGFKWGDRYKFDPSHYPPDIYLDAPIAPMHTVRRRTNELKVFERAIHDSVTFLRGWYDAAMEKFSKLT